MWPGILDDDNAADRHLGLQAGLAWGRVADASVVYEDLGISPGMAQGIARAVCEGREIEYRTMPHWQKKAPAEAEASCGEAVVKTSPGGR